MPLLISRQLHLDEVVLNYHQRIDCLWLPLLVCMLLGHERCQEGIVWIDPPFVLHAMEETSDDSTHYVDVLFLEELVVFPD